MLENRSFDQMLGCFQQIYPELDGIASRPPARQNADDDGNSYPQVAGAARVMAKDPNHDHPDVLQQLAGANGGFVRDFARTYPQSSSTDRAEIMKYHDLHALPALHALAENFTICDHWFSSLPGPTWPNRLFVHSGTSLGRVTMPEGIMNANLHWYDQPTTYDRLNERRIPWKIYFGDVPQSLVLVHQWAPRNMINYHHMQRFYEDVGGRESEFPAYVFIEPTYYPPGTNDDHPPHDVMDGERLIADVYNALRANEDLWRSTLLVILYDEHGGFYDHVSPPATVPPDHHQEEFAFDRLGVRVPALLVSPYAAKGVVNTVFDHTSLLKYLLDKWQLGSLGDRTAQARTFADKLVRAPRDDTPRTIPGPSTAGGVVAWAPRTQLSSHQAALFGLTHLLESMTGAQPYEIAARSSHVLTGPQSQIDVAVDRVEGFLAQQRDRFTQELARVAPRP